MKQRTKGDPTGAITAMSAQETEPALNGGGVKENPIVTTEIALTMKQETVEVLTDAPLTMNARLEELAQDGDGVKETVGADNYISGKIHSL